MPADKSNPTELRRTAEAVARGESIRKASITLDIERSTARRHMAAYCALPSDQIPDGEPQSVHSSDQTPNGAPTCAQSSDVVPDGAPVCTAPDQSSFAPPPGSHLHWCDLIADEGWQCAAEASCTARQRVIRSELIENRVRVYDPGVIYPTDLTGPRLGDPVNKAHQAGLVCVTPHARLLYHLGRSSFGGRPRSVNNTKLALRCGHTWPALMDCIKICGWRSRARR